jgi:capsular exopolysaccharide synthesis family protein
MELKRYILPLQRWWWLILAATVIAALSSFLATMRQPPIYQAVTTLMIGRVISDPNPQSSEFYLSQQLAANYAEIANREPVRLATMQALGLSWLPQYLARATPNSQFIEIVVTDTVPERAQAVANELGHQLVLRGPTSSTAEDQGRQDFVNQQLNNLEVQINDTEDEITKLQDELGNMQSARQIADTQNQINALQNKLTTMQGNYASLLANTSSGAVNTLSIIEPAPLPVRPIGPNKGLSILLASAIGFVLSGSAAYLLEYLDDTLKTPEEVERFTGIPIIGTIVEMGHGNGNGLHVAENPRHPVVEAYRSLRTNLEFIGVDKPLRTLFVASSDTGEGKTSVASNLAVVMSQAEKKVIVMDADLRRPNVHNFFGMPNDYGLSDVFRGRLSIEEALKEWRGGDVSVITAGSPPPNPAELLGSKKMVQILARLQEIADVIIIDGPPFVVTDAAVLAAKVDGVLVVVRSGHARQPAVNGMMEQLRRSGARVVGIALNRVPRKAKGYYAAGYYSSAYYSSSASEERASAPAERNAGPAENKSRNGMKFGLKRRGVLSDVDSSRLEGKG